jgi:hypothetical protein
LNVRAAEILDPLLPDVRDEVLIDQPPVLPVRGVGSVWLNDVLDPLVEKLSKSALGWGGNSSSKQFGLELAELLGGFRVGRGSPTSILDFAGNRINSDGELESPLGSVLVDPSIPVGAAPL